MVRARGVARKSFARRRVRRVKKYNSHVTPLRFKKYLPYMADLLAPKLAVEVGCETPTMELLESLGVPTDEWQYYLGFMKRMIVLYRNFTSETLASEKESLITEYVLRGKDRDVLEAVQEVAALCAEAIFEMDLWTRDFYKIIQFQSLDGFGYSGVGQTNINISGGILSMQVGPLIASSLSFSEDIGIPDAAEDIAVVTWDKNRKFRVAVYFETDTNQTIYIGVGDPVLAGLHFIGFKIVDNTIYGCVNDGSGEVLTVALGTITAPEDVLFEVRYTAGVECRFYVDNVEVGVLTSNLPSGKLDSDSIMYAYITNSAVESKNIYFQLWEFWQRR